MSGTLVAQKYKIITTTSNTPASLEETTTPQVEPAKDIVEDECDDNDNDDEDDDFCIIIKTPSLPPSFPVSFTRKFPLTPPCRAKTSYELMKKYCRVMRI